MDGAVLPAVSVPGFCQTRSSAGTGNGRRSSTSGSPRLSRLSAIRSRRGCNMRWSTGPFSLAGRARRSSSSTTISGTLRRDSIEGRLGFQRLVAEVGLGHVGLVLGVEMSRLARSCRDWHQLLEICALFDTLIADADGVYDPANYNDRLLLGLKGTMSEAELHILKARMLAGRRAKARRGELGKPVPMGYVRRPSGEVAFDPDEQAQATIRLVFDLFDRFRTVGKVMRYLVDHDIRMPVRMSGGPRKGELEWHRVNRVVAAQSIRQSDLCRRLCVWRAPDRPAAAEARPPGTGRRPPRVEDAEVFLPDRVPAYISWEQYQRNQAQLQAQQGGARLGSRAPGSALLSGRADLRPLRTAHDGAIQQQRPCRALRLHRA